MSAFEIRDGTYDLLVDGGYELSPTAGCLLWFLLLCTFHDPRHEWYGHVNPAMATNKALCNATRRSLAAVRRGMNELEALGFIQRTAQFGYNGFQRENDIELTVPPDFCFNCRTRGHQRPECPWPVRSAKGGGSE